MKKWGLLFLVCISSLEVFAEGHRDFHLQYRPESRQYQVVSSEDIRQLAIQGATIDAINFRLGSIDDNLKDIRGKLDNDVMPTIHVMIFFKWLFGALIVALITVVVNDWKKNRRHSAPAT